MKKIVLVLVLLLLSFLFGRERGKQAVLEGYTNQVDTLIVKDTILVESPKIVEKRVLVKDTIKISIIDTLVKKDTLLLKDTLFLPKEQVVYEDSTYRAVISGISPKLDSMYIYPKTIIIHTKEKPKKFSYGVQVGYGLLLPRTGGIKDGVYLGLGLEYKF